MHIEPLIKKLEKGWFYRILLYVLTNALLLIIIEVWTMPLWKILVLIPFMISYIIAYENLGIMFDRIKRK